MKTIPTLLVCKIIRIFILVNYRGTRTAEVQALMFIEQRDVPSPQIYGSSLPLSKNHH